MSEKKFTPGPWKVSKSPDYFENGATVIRAENNCVIAVLTDLDWPIPKAREANANLIAAAPELLEALEELSNRAHYADGGFYEDMIVKAEKAIKKALGTSE